MATLQNATLASANVALRFLLELAAVAVLGLWGYSVGRSRGARIALGVGVPLVVVVVWGLFGSPAAPYRLDGSWRLALEVTILAGAAVGLFLLDRPLAAVLFALVAAANTAFLHLSGRA